MRSKSFCPKCKGVLHFSNLEGKEKLICKKCNEVFIPNAEEKEKIPSLYHEKHVSTESHREGGAKTLKNFPKKLIGALKKQ